MQVEMRIGYGMEMVQERYILRKIHILNYILKFLESSKFDMLHNKPYLNENTMK